MTDMRVHAQREEAEEEEGTATRGLCLVPIPSWELLGFSLSLSLSLPLSL